MSDLIEDLRLMREIGGGILLNHAMVCTLLAEIERRDAQLAEAKALFLTERAEGVYPLEGREEEERDAEAYFDRMMELTAKQVEEAKQKPQGET